VCHPSISRRLNLTFDKLPIPQCRPGRNIASGFPLIDARPHELGNSHFRSLNVTALAKSGDQLGLFNLGLTLGAFEAVPLAFALTGLRIAHVDHDCPMAGRAFADVALHD
jgi:hypothetical protein